MEATKKQVHFLNLIEDTCLTEAFGHKKERQE
jgi:hypothetical protein